jgi:hypothetical protein
LTDFKRTDYGRGLAQPKEANVQAANALLSRERAKQLQRVRKLADAGKQVEVNPSTQRLTSFASLKDHVSRGTRKTEAIWHFYDNLFSQRLGPLADELAAMDRIALDCYQTCYMGLGRARSLPTPPPMAYMEPAAGPATYRRGVSVPKLSKLPKLQTAPQSGQSGLAGVDRGAENGGTRPWRGARTTPNCPNHRC